MLIEVRASKFSKDKYRVKFWNSGKGTAYGVNFELPSKGTEGLIRRDKGPYEFEFLESGKSFEEVLIVYNGVPNKFEIITLWKEEGEYGQRKKTSYFLLGLIVIFDWGAFDSEFNYCMEKF